jgi:hypothetical protein
MTKQLQSDLAELGKLKGIKIAMTDEEQPLLIGFSYEQKTPGDKALAWLWWASVVAIYGVCGLVLWWVMT